MNHEWLTPTQIDLIKDPLRKWQKETFTQQDAIVRRVNGGVTGQKKSEGEEPAADEWIMPGGWDHEHCALCWETISDFEGHQHSGYTDGKKWLCADCYKKYIRDDILKLRR